MTWHEFHSYALWLVIVGGVLPAAYFTATYRPRRRLAAEQLDAGGWVPIILALYLLAAWQIATGERRSGPWPEALVSLVVGFGIDALLWLRAFHWRRIRAKARRGS